MKPPPARAAQLAGMSRVAFLLDLKRYQVSPFQITTRKELQRDVAKVLSVPVVIDLGPGEAEVLAFGFAAPGALLLLDDGRAREIAAS